MLAHLATYVPLEGASALQWSKQSSMSIASGLFRTSVSHSDRVISMSQKTVLQRTLTCWEEAEERRPSEPSLIQFQDV